MKYDIELCMKVSEKQWIESLRNGTVCFNPIEVFIKKAEKNGNNEQGDRYEGIFARLHTSDRRVGELKIRFGDDLEIIPDNNYVLLRRKSSRKIPIFCMYGVRRDELDLQEGSIHKENGKYIDYDPSLKKISESETKELLKNKHAICGDGAEYVYVNTAGDTKQYFPETLDENSAV